jgi:hypothetical protein
LRKATEPNVVKMISTPWVRKLAAFLQLLSLLGETRVRAQALKTFSIACEAVNE